MMGHFAEVLAVVFAAFVAGSAIGWLLYRLIDRTRLGHGQEAISEAIGRGLGLTAAVPVEQRLLRRAERERNAEGRLPTRVPITEGGRPASRPQSPYLGPAVAHAARPAPRGIAISPSEALAAAKTAGARALIPAVTLPRSERDAVKVRAAKVGNVWTVDGGVPDDDRRAWDDPLERRTARQTPERPQPSARAQSGADPDQDDSWAAPPGATWPIGSGARLLPSPQRVANGAGRPLLRLEAKRPGPILLAGPGPAASDAIWADEPKRGAGAGRKPAPPRLSAAAPASGDGKIVAANGRHAPLLGNGGAAVRSSRFGRALADAADRAWDKPESDQPPASRRTAVAAAPSPPVLANPARTLIRPAAKTSPPAPLSLSDGTRANGSKGGNAAPFLFPTPPARRDNLRRVRGIGHSFEHRLHDLGVYQLVQIANWSAKEQAWIGNAIAAPGKVEREDWVGQAQALIAVRKASGSRDAEVLRDS